MIVFSALTSSTMPSNSFALFVEPRRGARGDFSRFVGDSCFTSGRHLGMERCIFRPGGRPCSPSWLVWLSRLRRLFCPSGCKRNERSWSSGSDVSSSKSSSSVGAVNAQLVCSAPEVCLALKDVPSGVETVTDRGDLEQEAEPGGGRTWYRPALRGALNFRGLD